MTDSTTRPAAPRVLLVEDEAPILDGLDALFRAQGFETERAADGLVATAALAERRFDLVVLDLMIPGLSGLDVLRRFRARGDETPVLVLTARGAEEDVVLGLEAGADDYVTKPFGIRELVARAKGLLRRPRAPGEPVRRIQIGAVSLDLDAQLITFTGGELRLTSREALLLGYLEARKHRAVTREELLVDVWGYRDGTIRTRTVDVHVQQLRTKLKAVPGGESWVGTVRGRGYRFEVESP